MAKLYDDIWYEGHDGAKLYARHYENKDSDTTILCLHGLTRNSKDFAELAELFVKDHSVVVPDQRGRGRSQWTAPSTYTPAHYVKDMWRLLEKLNKKHVIIIGTSMGGLMSMIMVSSKPDYVDGVVLNDIGPEVDSAGLARIKDHVGSNNNAADWDEAKAMCRTVSGVCFPDYTDAQWESLTRKLYREGDNGLIVLDYDPALDEAVHGGAENVIPPDLWPMFESFYHKPLLVLRGEHSDLFRQDCFDKMLTLHAHDISRGVTVKNRGHAPMLDEPQAVEALQIFIPEVVESVTRKN